MIKSIYIMRENGELLYVKNFLKEKYDSNILIGFFTSIANFSREALGTIVKNLDLGENNKLILTPIPESELLAAAIVSEKDHNELINKILNKLSDFFIRSAENRTRTSPSRRVYTTTILHSVKFILNSRF